MSFEIIRSGLAWAPDEPVSLPPISRAREPFGPYLFDEPLALAVNAALHLGRPLLVTGEPGTGKTALAWGIARRLGAGEVLEFHAKSTSTARDLLYAVDNMRRFHDAQVGDERARDVSGYIQLRALGEAIRSPQSRVVLIDEIDKANRDFPNDLLNELDRMRFEIDETGEHFEAAARHMVLITSNSERRLPSAFLRRCVYHHITFPSTARLQEIVELHTRNTALSAGFLKMIIDRFERLRAVDGLTKPPATDELLAWIRVLSALNLDTLPGKLADLPALQTLIKHRDDLERLSG